MWTEAEQGHELGATTKSVYREVVWRGEVIIPVKMSLQNKITERNDFKKQQQNQQSGDKFIKHKLKIIGWCENNFKINLVGIFQRT